MSPDQCSRACCDNLDGGGVSIIQRFTNGNVDQELFERVHRAAKTIEGSLEVGINEVDFHNQLQQLATELEILRDKAVSQAEREILSQYQDALDIYVASELIWDTQNKSKTTIKRHLESETYRVMRQQSEATNDALESTTRRLIGYEVRMSHGWIPVSHAFERDDEDYVEYAAARLNAILIREKIDPVELKSIVERYELPSIVEDDFLFVNSTAIQHLWHLAAKKVTNAAAQHR